MQIERLKARLQADLEISAKETATVDLIVSLLVDNFCGQPRMIAQPEPKRRKTASIPKTDPLEYIGDDADTNGEEVNAILASPTDTQMNNVPSWMMTTIGTPVVAHDQLMRAFRTKCSGDWRDSISCKLYLDYKLILIRCCRAR